MSFYNFSTKELERATRDSRFQACLNFLHDHVTVLSTESFRGDPDILDQCQQLATNLCAGDKVQGNSAILDKYPLVYLSPCFDAEDVIARDEMLARAKSKSNSEWWFYYHECIDLAVFIIYPIVKILWPEKEFFLIHGNHHTLITTLPPEKLMSDSRMEFVFFDLIYPQIDLPISLFIEQELSSSNLSDWKFNTEPITNAKLVKWYTANYDYTGFPGQLMATIFSDL